MTEVDFPATIGAVLAGNATRLGAKTAFIGPDGATTSFALFAQRVRVLALALRARGIAPGERIAILSRNRSEYLEVVCLAAYGFVVIPLNWRLSTAELSYVLGDAEPAAIFADEGSVPVLDGLEGATTSAVRIVFGADQGAWAAYEAMISDQPDAAMAMQEDPEAIACIVYTSGTTGRPKGAELRQSSLLLNSRETISCLELTKADVTLCPMPLFHVGGLWYHAFPSFVAGCTTVVLAEFAPDLVLQAISLHHVTNMHVVPTMLHVLLRHPARASADVSSLRVIFYAGSSMPGSVLTEAMAAFRDCGFVQGYGSTEAGFVSYLSAQDHRRAAKDGALTRILTSCGRACARVDLTLLDAWIDGDGLEIGEIGVASDLRMTRYWRNGDATAAAFAGPYLRTGDLGRVDREGYIYILDRKNDMIVTGGENVYPREVEDVLLDDPTISEVAVYDLPDPKWVQKVVAAVVLRKGVSADPDDIIARARLRLAAYKCPKEIRFVEVLPRNPAGKVLRKTLRQQIHDERMRP